MQFPVEYLTPEKLAELQLEKLLKTVSRVFEHVEPYRDLFIKLDITPSDIRSLDDLSKFPLTDKETLRQNYPFGMFAVPMVEIKEIHGSSGTTGKPTVVAYTEGDLRLWREVMARSLLCAGVNEHDIIQNAYGYGLFTGGLGIHYGALELGSAVVPMSSGGSKRQLQLMQDFGTTVLTCTPSYAVYLAELAAAQGIDPRETKIRIGILGAEPWSDGMRREIEQAWDMAAYDIYGLSEIIGPGVAMECPGQNGLHIWADHFYPEVIDPVTGKPVKPGQDGMLVITTLTKQATPFLRYATKDIVSIEYGECPACGRTSPRMSRVKGRTDDMLIIRGINVFPSQIESVLMEIEETEPHYQLVVTRDGALDKLEVQVEVGEQYFSDEIKVLEGLSKRIRAEIENVLAISVDVKLVEPKSIQRSEGKARRVIDLRTM